MPQILVKNGDGFPWDRDIRELTRVDEDTGQTTLPTMEEARARYKARRKLVRQQEFDKAGQSLPPGIADFDELIDNETEDGRRKCNVHGQIVGVFPDDHIFGTGERKPGVFKVIQVTERELLQMSNKMDVKSARQHLRQRDEDTNVPQFCMTNVDFDDTRFLIPRTNEQIVPMPANPQRDHGRIQPTGTAGVYALRASGLSALDGESATYTTITAWQDAHKGQDLSGTSPCILKCYNDWPDGLDEGGETSITGWAGATETAYPHILGRNSRVHRYGAFTLASSGVAASGSQVNINYSWVRIEGIVLSSENGTVAQSERGITLNPTTMATKEHVLRCLVMKSGGAQTNFTSIFLSGHTSRTDQLIVVNCMTIGGNNGIYLYTGGVDTVPQHVLGCTAIGATTYGIRATNTCATSTVTNCLMDGNGTDWSESGWVVDGESYIATSDATAAGTGSVGNVVPIYLVDGHPSGVTHDDYRLHPDDVDCALAGADLSSGAAFDVVTDIDGRARPSGSAQSIGASEPYTVDELADFAEMSYDALRAARRG